MYGYGNASPARDISWHPFMPVLASTEFNGCVNIWSMQNIGEEERQKMAAQAQSGKEAKGKGLGIEYGDEEEEEVEDEEEEDSMSSMFGGSQFVMIRGANGAAYRIPLSLLRQIMANEDQEDEQEAPEEEDESKGKDEEKEEEEEKADSDNDLYSSNDEMPGLESE